MSSNNDPNAESNGDSENVKRYRLTGDNHSQNDDYFRKGDIVELTEEQYTNFAFKFEPLEQEADAQRVAAPAQGDRAKADAQQRVAADEARVENPQMRDRDGQQFVANAGAEDPEAVAEQDVTGVSPAENTSQGTSGASETPAPNQGQGQAQEQGQGQGQEQVQEQAGSQSESEGEAGNASGDRDSSGSPPAPDASAPSSDADSDAGQERNPDSDEAPFDPSDLTVTEVRSRIAEDDYSQAELDALQQAESEGDDRRGVAKAIDNAR